MILLILSFLVIPGPQSVVEHSITGRVVDAQDGSAIPGASVEAVELGLGAMTQSDGSFDLHPVPGGNHTLRIRHVGYVSVDTVVAAPAGGLVLQLQVATVDIEEVVVTGSPIGSAARYQAAQAFGRLELDRLSAASLGEMLDGSPGVAMRSMGSAPARPVVRGFDGDRVLVLENGERSGDLSETAADHALALDPLLAQRVEVVRGPASLLYGSGALGGVVNVLSDDITREWRPGMTGDLAVQGSSMNRGAAAMGKIRYGSGDWSVGGRFAARGAGDVRTPEGVLPDTDMQTVDLGAGGSYRTNSFSGGVAVSGLLRSYGIPEAIDDPDERIEIRMQRQSLSGVGEWRFDGFIEAVELRINAARYAHDEIELEAGVEELELSFDQRVVSSTLTARHGALGFLDRGAIGVNVFARDLMVGGGEALTPDGSAARFAAFAFEEADLGALLSLQMAVRGEVELTGIRPNGLFPDARDSRTVASLSGAVGLNARPASGLEVGVQVAQAFRSPTMEERYSDAAHVGAGAYEVGDPDLGLERALGLDGFARLGLGPVSLEAAVFAMRIDDFVVYQPTGEIHGPSGLPIFVYEADQALQLGGEASLDANITESLSFAVGVDYVRGTRLGDGRPLPRIPPLRGRVGALLDRGTWWAGGRVRLVAPQHRTADNEEATGGYVLAGLEAGMRLGPDQGHLVTLRVDNIFDVAYRDHLSRVEARHAPMPGQNLTLTYRIMW